jgi:hypothetical protein
MRFLASCFQLAWLVPVVLAACSSSSTPPTPDYDGLRKEDDMKHGAFPGPSAAPTNVDWPSLAPGLGAPINMGVNSGSAGGAGGAGGMGGGGTGGTGGMDAGPPDTGVDTGTPNYDLAITNYTFTIPSNTKPSPSLFVSDPNSTIIRTGAATTLIIPTTSYATLTFSWTAPDSNAIGYAIQFGSQAYMYLSNTGFTGFTSGTGSMSIEVVSSVCSQLPSTCFLTSMKLYLVTRPVDGGINVGLSPAATIPVAINCGGCIP